MSVNPGLPHSTQYCRYGYVNLPNRYLRCFQFSTITNNAAVSILAHTPLHVYAGNFSTEIVEEKIDN